MLRRMIPLCGCAWLPLFAGALWAAPPDGPPNLVLIIADDMAWDDCGAYGHPSIRTPNLDALADAGMRFDRAFLACSSCSPSRSSLITGTYPHETGAEELHWPLPEDRNTFARELREAGYWTAAAGKWHLGEAARDHFDLIRGARAPEGPNAEEDAYNGPASGCGAWVPTLRDRPRDRPFFLWLAAVDPHRGYQSNTIPEPHEPQDAIVPPYLPDVPETRADLALYYDEIARMDYFIGRVLEELEAQGVADETLVLFISDNGRPFPRCKTTVYDSGIRTPMIARWPGRIPEGTVCDALVSSVDIAPTFLTVAGIEPPETMSGREFSRLFADPSASVRPYVFAEHNWHDYTALKRAVRDERFKYIRNHDATIPLTPPADAVRSPTFTVMKERYRAGLASPAESLCFRKARPYEELYDLETDPHELNNLAADPNHQETLERLRAALDAWQERTRDELPAVLSPDGFDRWTGRPLPDRPNRLGPRDF